MKKTFTKFMLLLFALVVGMSNVWADSKPWSGNDPSTTLDLQTITSSTMGTWSGAVSWYLDNDYLIVTGYESYQNVSDQTWITQSSVGNSASSWDASSPFKGSSYYTNKNYATIQAGRYLLYKVTNLKSLKVYGKNNSTSKYLDIFIYTKSNNDYTRVEEIKYTTDNNVHIWENSVTLSASETYYIYITGVGSSNSRVFEVAFERNSTAPKYTLSSVVNPSGVGSVTLGATQLSQGSSTTITASVTNSAYRFKNWTKTSGTITNENASSTTFTMGNTDAIVTANFELIPTYTVTLGDDNSTLTEETAGAGVTLPTRSDIAGYTLAGWSSMNIPDETTTAPETIIPTGTYYPTENITLYPVYTKSGGGTTPSAFSVGDTGDYAIVSAAQNSKYYALPTNPTVSSGKITGQEITVNELNNVKYITPSNASGFTWTIASATNGYTLSDGTNYIYHSNGGSSGTNLAYGNSTSYTWNFTADGDYVTMAGMSGSTTNNRGMLFQGTTIGGYALSNASSSGYYKIMILPISAGSTTYYWSSPVAPTVEKPTITLAENPFLFSTTVTITCATDGATIKYSYDGETWSNYPNAGLTITETKTIYAKGVKDQDESQVVQATATKHLAQPTVTISGNLIVDLDGETNVNAGTLSAAVTYNNEPISGTSVTWSSNHTEIATIDASTGAVTLLTTGTVTFTATYAQNSDYDEATDTKTITVIDSKGPGSMYDPYTVAEARAAIDAGTGVTGVYATGIVSEIVTEYSSTYHNISYNISTNGESSGDQLQSYRGKSYNGDNFTSSNDIKVGDIVVIYGNMKNYKDTYEFEQDNQLVSLVRPGTGGDPTTIAGTVVDFTINDKSYTVAANTTLIVTGTLVNNNAANLIIEDGGQLITSSQVKATFKKTTIASSEAKDATNNWYAISSPVDEIAISSFAAGTHNVYSYIEKSHYWNEYRGVEDQTLGTEPFDNLENGHGYLYRSTASGIDFKGDVNIDNATYSLTYTPAAGNLAGFHLIGNPYTHNIYKGANAAINSEYLTDGLYTLNVNGGWVAGTDNSTVIAPGCAVLVQTTEAGEGKTLTITNTDHQGPQAKYANDQIMFTVENTEYSDNSYVLFKKGQGLNKVEHRNAEIPMLYVISEGENYAIADMPDNTDVINLGFEAKTMGQYTISLKAEGQYSYMHLVDKLTGNDIDMLVEDSYTFVGTPNDRNDRFVLRLNYNAAGIDTESDIFAYQSGNDIMVSGEGELQVFDITGRKVMTTDINGVETINGMNRGVYIFRLNEKTQKIVVR